TVDNLPAERGHLEPLPCTGHAGDGRAERNAVARTVKARYRSINDQIKRARLQAAALPQRPWAGWRSLPARNSSQVRWPAAYPGAAACSGGTSRAPARTARMPGIHTGTTG